MYVLDNNYNVYTMVMCNILIHSGYLIIMKSSREHLIILIIIIIRNIEILKK